MKKRLNICDFFAFAIAKIMFLWYNYIGRAGNRSSLRLIGKIAGKEF